VVVVLEFDKRRAKSGSALFKTVRRPEYSTSLSKISAKVGKGNVGDCVGRGKVGELVGFRVGTLVGKGVAGTGARVGVEVETATGASVTRDD